MTLFYITMWTLVLVTHLALSQPSQACTLCQWDKPAASHYGTAHVQPCNVHANRSPAMKSTPVMFTNNNTWLLSSYCRLETPEITCSHMKLSLNTVSIRNKAAHTYYIHRDTEDRELPAIASDLPFGLKMGHWNLQSMGNKYDQLKPILEQSKKEIDILGISESWLDEKCLDSLVNIAGYNLEHKDRIIEKSGGGVFVYLNDMQSLSDPLECVLLELAFPKSTPLLLCNAYRPP